MGRHQGKNKNLKQIFKQLIAWGVIGGVGAMLLIGQNKLSGIAERHLPDELASVVNGMVLGERGVGKLYMSWRKSGMLHLLVASGSNVMLLSRVVIESLVRYLGRKKTVVMGLIVVWMYAAMVGWEMPIIRASLAVSIYYYAQLMGRKFNVFRAVVLIGLIMGIGEVRVILSLSWWMSMAAYVAVVSGDKVWGEWLGRKRGWLKLVWENLLTGVWVNLWLLPIMAINFGKINPVGLIANLITIWLTPIVTIGGGIGIGLGLINFGSGEIWFSWLKFPILALTETAKWLSWWPIAEMEIQMGWWEVIGIYMVLGWVVVRSRRRYLSRLF